MPRKERDCSVPNCGRPVRTRGYCDPHYQRLRRYGDVRADEPIATPIEKATPAAAGPPSVLADLAWPDPHPDAPGGQRLALYSCMVCGRQHLCSWLPFDKDPGLKSALCRSGTAVSPKTSQVYVLAPSPERVLDAPPPGYAPGKREASQTGFLGEVEVDKARVRSKAEVEVERAWLGVMG